MAVVGLLWACALAAAPAGGSPDEAASARKGGRLGPKRDLFGTSGRGREERPSAPARLWGTVELSDGEGIEGRVALAPGRPLEVYDLEAREWREFGLHEIVELRATPRREDLEREWRWKEYGKDEKVYTGRTYPRRWLDHELVVRAEGEKDGKGPERISCHVRGAVLHLTTVPAAGASGQEDAAAGKGPEGGERRRDAPRPRVKTVPPKRLRFVLRQYERGRLGQTLDDLVYVKRVTIHGTRRPGSAGRGEKPPPTPPTKPEPDGR